MMLKVKYIRVSFQGAAETKQFDSSSQSSSVFHQVDLIFIFSSFCFCCDKADPGYKSLCMLVCGCFRAQSEIHKPGDGLKLSFGEKVARKASG